jgi:FkbM family methyltransferase
VPDRIKHALLRTGLGERARRVKHALDPAGVRQARRDHDHLGAVLAALLGPDADCIDVGANEGDVLADMVRLAPRGRHLAFEPLPQLAEALRTRFPGVTVHEAALGDHEGRASFVHVVTRPGWSGFRERPYPAKERVETIEVEVLRLDDVVRDGLVPKLIKIDVEGAEMGVLRGAERTLRELRPVVIFEHGLGSADHYGTRPEELFGFLEDVGYRVLDLDGGGPYTRDAFVGAFDRRERVNFLARP